MGTVTINPPKTPVTKGCNSISKASIPNVCKMPGPPAPFVPSPLPNIGKSGNSPKKYSKKVKFDGNTIAIKGSSFASQGDIASKGTGGGLISANTHGPTKFIGPGSMDVKVEGKNVQLLADPMLNNCGASGSPPNSATLMGTMHESGSDGEDYDCVEGANRIEKLLCANKRKKGKKRRKVGGEHGYLMRLAEQICGKEDTESEKYGTHEGELNRTREKLKDEIDAFDAAGCDINEIDFEVKGLNRRKKKDRNRNIRDAVDGIRNDDSSLKTVVGKDRFLGRGDPKCNGLDEARNEPTLNAIRGIIGF